MIVFSCLLIGDCCLVACDYCSLVFACCLSLVVRLLVSVVCCLLIGDWCLLIGCCCVSFVDR